MRKFKHKATGFEAITYVGDEKYYDVANTKDHCSNLIPAYIIEGSNDWIEIKDDDWIDLVEEELNTGVYNIRQIINQFLPKITDDMIEKIWNELLSNKEGFSRDATRKTIKQNLPKDLLANPE